MSDVEEKIVELINSINTLSDLVNAVQGSMTHLSEQITSLEEKITLIDINALTSRLDELALKFDNFSNAGDKLDLLSEIPDIKQKLNLLSDLPSIRNMMGILDSKIDQVLSKPEIPVSRPQAPVEEAKTPTPSEQKSAPTVSSSEVLDSSFEVEKPPKKEGEYISPGLKDEDESPVSTTDADAQVAIDALSSKFKHISQMITPQSVGGSVLKYLEELRDEVETSVGMSPMLYEINSWLKKVDKMKEEEPLLPDIHSDLTEKLDDWKDRVLSALRRKYE